MNNEVSLHFTNKVTGQAKLEKYSETLNKLQTSLAGIDTNKASQIEGIAKSTTNYTKTDTTKAANVGKSISKSYDFAGITAFFGIFHKLTQSINKNIDLTADYLENMNLLDVAYNNDTTEADKLVNKMSEMYGLDESWGYKTVGMFKQLANAMGFTDETMQGLSETGTQLSNTLTQLAVDLSSLYNVSTSSAVEKLQSALAGQTKPIRTFGADITESTLQLTLMQNGIDRTVDSLTYAEKRLLIVTAILEQTEEAQGDWGRTIESIANQMRVFDEQVSRLGRAIGSVFLPVLKVIIPYLNAFLMVLTEIISWIAILVGYNEEEFDFFSTDDSVSDLEDSISGVGASLDSASDSAKKLKSGLRGFDKLNNITTPSASTSTSTVGASGIDSNILDLFNKKSKEYLDNLTNVEMKATQIRDRIMEWLGFTKLVDDTTGDVSFKFDHITGGTVLGALVVGGTIYSGIKGILKLLSNFGLIEMPNFSLSSIFSGVPIGTIVAIAAAIGLIVYSLYDLYQENEEFAKSFDEKWQGIKDAVSPIVEDIKKLFETLKSTYEETLKPMINEAYEIIQTLSATILEILYPVFKDFIIPVIDELIKIINDCFTIINDLWSEYGEPISEAIKEAIGQVEDIFKKLWEQVLSPIIEKIKEIINDLWETTLKPMFEKVGEVIGELIELVLALWNNVLAPIVKWLIDVLGPKFEAIFSKVADVVHVAVKTIGGVINGLLDILKGVIKFLTGIFSGDFKKALSGLVDILKGIINIILSVVEGMVNSVITVINAGIKFIFNGIKSLVNTVLSTVENIAEILGFNVDLTLKGKAPQISKVSIPRLKTGMEYIPKDFYGPVYLDQGERVLTKQENQEFSNNLSSGFNSNSSKSGMNSATFIIQVGNKEIAKQVITDLQDMAKTNGQPITIGG